MGQGPRYAIFFVPAAESELYRFGSSVLGYDCYRGDGVAHPRELTDNEAEWRSLTDEPRRYGFHATLKAPFHLSPAFMELQLIEAVRSFALSQQMIATIAPAIELLGGFAAIVPRQPEPRVETLAARCTIELDSFRAPMAAQERARRMAAGLSQIQIENLDRWGYPYVLGEFRFHLTLTGRVDRDRREAVLTGLRQSFARRCEESRVPIDRLALLKQDGPQTPFRMLTQAHLSAAR
jgi:putative phosphonate metabolism protein